MKYIKQKTNYDCGPVALMNAFIWAGTPVDYKNNSQHFKDYLNFIDEFGTQIHVFTRIMKRKKNKFPFKVVDVIELPSIKEIRQNVNDKKCVILGMDTKRFAHVGLIIKMTDKYVTLVNWLGTGTIRRVHVNTLRKWISKWAIIYVIEKP